MKLLSIKPKHEINIHAIVFWITSFFSVVMLVLLFMGVQR